MGRTALITLVIRTLGKLIGRTKLQKTLYLTNLCGWNVIPDFKYYFYGPYSEMVNVEVENMRNNGWVEERIHSSWNDNILYTYSLSRTGKKISESLGSRYDDKLVKRTRSLITHLNKFSLDDLEMMATLVFLKEENKGMSEEELVKEVARLKPKFDTAEIKKNLRIFNILRDFRK